MTRGALILHFSSDHSAERAPFIAAAQEAVGHCGLQGETRLLTPTRRSVVVDEISNARLATRARRLLSVLGIASAAQIERKRGAIKSVPEAWRGLAWAMGVVRTLRGGTPAEPEGGASRPPDWMQPDLPGLEHFARGTAVELPSVILAAAGRTEDAELLANLPVANRRLRKLVLIVAPYDDLASAADSRGAIWRAALDVAYDVSPEWVPNNLPAAHLANVVKRRLQLVENHAAW